MKKILLLLLTVLTFTSCVETYRSDDIFVVTSKENGNTSYKYLYRVNHYTKSTRKGLYYETYYHFVSNDNYELGDTIRFIRYASNER
jgi:hypothetical protein